MPPPVPCSARLDGTFVQIAGPQLRYDPSEWRVALEPVRALGMQTLVIQYSGDGRGSYDRFEGPAPSGTVAALLEAADGLDLQVYLGLHDNPQWPDRFAMDLPAPLGTGGMARLASMCAAHRSCVGWYLPQELEDFHAERLADQLRLRDWLREAVALLHSFVPRLPVAISAFAAGRFGPEEYARFWAVVLAGSVLDILMFQDGMGTGRASAASVSAYLGELAPVARRHHVQLWGVTELFEQLQGTPWDTRVFRARPARFSRVRAGMNAASPFVERLIGFSVLDYMDPSLGREAARLSRRYAASCAATGPR
ncbi:MAG: DUF4434 domain-containing protein [Deltaproteobacteria bacterium]